MKNIFFSIFLGLVFTVFCFNLNAGKLSSVDQYVASFVAEKQEGVVEYDAELDKLTFISKPVLSSYATLSTIAGISFAFAASSFYFSLRNSSMRGTKAVKIADGILGSLFAVIGISLTAKVISLLTKRLNRTPCFILDSKGIYSLKDKDKVAWNSVKNFEIERITTLNGFREASVDRKLHFLDAYKGSLLTVSSNDSLLPVSFDCFCALVEHYFEKYAV